MPKNEPRTIRIRVGASIIAVLSIVAISAAFEFFTSDRPAAVDPHDAAPTQGTSESRPDAVVDNEVGPIVRSTVRKLAYQPLRGTDDKEACQRIALLGKKAVPVLLLMLEDEDVLVRTTARDHLQGIACGPTLHALPRAAEEDLDRWRNLVVRPYQEWWEDHKAKSRMRWLVDAIRAEGMDSDSAATRVYAAMSSFGYALRASGREYAEFPTEYQWLAAQLQVISHDVPVGLLSSSREPGYREFLARSVQELISELGIEDL